MNEGHEKVNLSEHSVSSPVGGVWLCKCDHHQAWHVGAQLQCTLCDCDKFAPSFVEHVQQMEREEIRWKSVAGYAYNPDWSGYTAAPASTGFPERGWCLYSRGAGGCWNQRTLTILPPEPNAKPVRRDGKWWWAVEAPSDPENGNSPATSVSSPDSKELLAALKTVIASANPHPMEHGVMYEAWQIARKAIAKAEKSPSPVSSVERDKKDLGEPGGAHTKHEPRTE